MVDGQDPRIKRRRRTHLIAYCVFFACIIIATGSLVDGRKGAFVAVGAMLQSVAATYGYVRYSDGDWS